MKIKAYKYQKVDAFTSNQSAGNPAACIFLNEKQTLSETAMQEIARQHKGFVSEVIYCSSHEGIFLTYYSSECEVSFCGHGTIACMYNLVKNTETLLACNEIPIHTNKKGDLTVYNQIEEQDAVFISAPKPNYLATPLKASAIIEPLGLSSEDISNELPIDFIDAGLRTLLVPLQSTAKLIEIFPNEANLKHFCLQKDIDIILVFSMDAVNKSHIAHTRVFAPKFGYLEDPATGSGNSAFGYYMLKYKLWNGALCSIEQGGNDRVFNVVKLHFQNDNMLFGGKGTTRIDGAYYY
ncbi:MAG: PhzF family phenazine biosynthesis isomerase [Eubacteriales bacterium]|nr:PhzF family phenazine biosynthesis isomerase [Eubacteriales bacterium]MDD4390947.1 PhzF family phenazine biosynthesis isomerase [Eubacteriales bacterium]